MYNCRFYAFVIVWTVKTEFLVSQKMNCNIPFAHANQHSHSQMTDIVERAKCSWCLHSFTGYFCLAAGMVAKFTAVLKIYTDST